MMRPDASGSLSREFAIRIDRASFLRFTQQQFDERKRRERADDLRNEASDLLDVASLIITAEQATEFRLELDGYDAATVGALQHNLEQQALVRKRLDDMLARAYVLPDGRRVFKTEDGLRVFDEFGAEVGPEIVDPDAIGDDAPRWEEYDDKQKAMEALEREQAEILDFQEKLDDARERLDSGEMTQEEYDRLREDLKADMPDAVRAQIPELAEKHAAIALSTVKAAELDFSEDVTPTVRISSGPAPG